jgi:hypothetical protein
MQPKTECTLIFKEERSPRREGDVEAGSWLQIEGKVSPGGVDAKFAVQKGVDGPVHKVTYQGEARGR